MNSLDLFILIPILWGAHKGYKSGLLMNILSLVSFVAAIILGFKFWVVVLKVLRPFVGNMSESIMPYVAFVVTFALFFLLANRFARYLKSVIDTTLLGSFDNLLGAALGGLKFAFIVSLFLMIFHKIANQITSNKELIQNSVLYPVVEPLAPYVIKNISSVIAFGENIIQEAKEIINKKSTKCKPIHMNSPLLFATQSYGYLQEKLLQLGGFRKGVVEVKTFPDGERYQRILISVEGENVVLLGGTPTDTDTLELYDLASAINMYGAKNLTIVIPYFGYSTMERAVQRGEVVTAKTRARLLSSIPKTGSRVTFVLMDLHTEGLPHYFEGDVQSVHLYCKEVIIQACQEIAGKDFILASTDAGRAKWVESLANDMGVGAAFVLKKRINEHESLVAGVSADVAGQTVIIYDDMVRTGGSLINAARSYKNAGAGKIYAVTTHGLFSNNALQRLQESCLFEKIYCTDTHPNSHKYADSSFLVIKSVVEIIKKRIIG